METSGKKVGLTGATGLLGGNLAIELLKQGHQVRATRRGNSRIEHLKDFEIEWVEAELHETDLEKAFAGLDAVFHCAALVSIQKKPTSALIKANIQGTEAVLKAVKTADVPRMVYCSTVGAIGLSENGQPCTEENTWNFDKYGMDDGYVTTKYQSQQKVMQAAQAGMDVVTVNPTYMFGPYDPKPSSGKMIVDIVKGKTPGWTPGKNNFVDVRDVARGMILAWEKGRSGEKYILGGENLSYGEIFRKIASIAAVKAPSWKVPRALATLLGWKGDLEELITGKEPLINSVSINYGYCQTFQFSSAKAMAELGYSPGPINHAIRDAIIWFKEQGML